MLQKQVETRNAIEFRVADNSREISGYIVVFNTPSVDIGFTERVDPHAFDGVDMSQVQLLYNHDSGNILARVDSNTLKLSVDDRGLFFSAQMPETTLGNDTLENIRNGNLKGCSFGFTVAEDDWSYNGTGDSRTILKIDQLFEGSITPIPAYPDTSVALAARNKVRKSNSQKFLNLLRLTEIENQEF
ncbi:HK97 family phage prohead protease [Oenococcus alcoholitolerans]|uniref:Prohead serine protease domain-containing protein n=1 Tax=Oenococcus alcoholitolerans TaxID=931074 RepID=A0ABR4XPJ3_9LACO|nr:hypothetical protein Q757_07845 [Oenococcus alcoholitolerans]